MSTNTENNENPDLDLRFDDGDVIEYKDSGIQMEVREGNHHVWFTNETSPVGIDTIAVPPDPFGTVEEANRYPKEQKGAIIVTGAEEIMNDLHRTGWRVVESGDNDG